MFDSISSNFPLSFLDPIQFNLVSDLPDSATDLIGEGSAHPSQVDEEKLNWLLNLDVNHDTAVYQPATPISVQSTIPSTPALPDEVVGSDHTETPNRFSPELEYQIEEDQRTVSEGTYNNIRKSFYTTVDHFFFFLFFFILV